MPQHITHQKRVILTTILKSPYHRGVSRCHLKAITIDEQSTNEHFRPSLDLLTDIAATKSALLVQVVEKLTAFRNWNWRFALRAKLARRMD
ncbi:MAG: hypothetical protein DMF20_06335 [Verrucomicrobia bacterium]|nr:MAG: hypothetical protein DMF20_06335 [Verrucomicrobiota bacterium]